MGVIELLLLLLLAVLLLAALPVFPHSRRWGFAPSGSLFTVLLIVVLLVVVF